jgi:hypothetical protein
MWFDITMRPMVRRVLLFLSANCAVVAFAHVLSGCSTTPSGPVGDATAPDTIGGGCAEGLTICNGQCADLMRDRANCGECGLACNTKASEICVMGQCVFGCNGTTKCGDFCVDTNNDPANCGGCGMKCDPGYVCQAGKCQITCLNGFDPCDTDAGKRCSNLQNDEKNCGACGNACPPGSLCDQGSCAVKCQMGLDLCPSDGGERCVDLKTDTENCGTCGNRCTQGLFCSPNVADGGDGGASCGLQCFGGTTKCGNKCADTKIDPKHCGGCFMPCGGGQTCVNGSCQ